MCVLFEHYRDYAQSQTGSITVIGDWLLRKASFATWLLHLAVAYEAKGRGFADNSQVPHEALHTTQVQPVNQEPA